MKTNVNILHIIQKVSRETKLTRYNLYLVFNKRKTYESTFWKEKKRYRFKTLLTLILQIKILKMCILYVHLMLSLDVI